MRLSLLQWGISNRSTIQCLPISKFEKWKQQYKYEGIVPARLCDDLNQQVRPGGLEVNFRNSVYADESAIFQSFSALHCTQQYGMYTSATHTIWHEIQAGWYSWHEIQLYFCSTQPVTSGLTRCAGTSSKGSAGSLANARTANSTSCITQVGTCQVNFQLIFTLISSSLIKYSEPISYLQGLFHLTIFVTHSEPWNELVLPFWGKSHLRRWGIVPTFIVYNLVSWGNVVRQTPSLFRPFPTILGVAKMEAFL